MDELSRSEKKRRAKGIEHLAAELVNLSTAEINQLACDELLKTDIKEARHLKAGARKRQIKYISKQLRELDPEPLLEFLAEKKGSKLKQDREFHKLEHWRDDIISEAIEYYRELEPLDEPFDENCPSPVLDRIEQELQNLDRQAVKLAAVKYVKTRKPAFSREIFRILKAAHEGQKFQLPG